MMGVLMIFIPISLLIVVVVIASMWYDGAFHGDRILEERQRRAAAWRPPFARGEELLRWAREAAARLVGQRLAEKRTAATPGQLATDLHEGALRAMLPVATDRDSHRRVACPDEGQGMIGVTAPEVFEIADYLRQNVPSAERHRIAKLARENAKKLAGLDDTNFDADQTPCPLQGQDCICRVYSARPLHCRPLHAARIANELGLPTAGFAGEIPPWASHLQTVQQGFEEGVVQALDKAGLDARVYELNGALAIALENSEAARCWMQGEDVFANCRRYA